MIQGLNHITLSVKDLDRSCRFYGKILNFKPIMKSESNAYFLAGDLWYCLQVDSTVRSGPLPEYTHIAFTVSADSFEKLKHFLQASGVNFWKENTSEGDSLYFLDPDHHKLEIHVGDWRTRLKEYENNLIMKKFIISPENQLQRRTQNSESKNLVKESDLSLIGFKTEFLDKFFEWRNQPATMAHNPIEQKSKQELLKDLSLESSELSDFSTATKFRWFAEFQNQIVGNVSFKNINKTMMTTEIAYGLDQAYLGRGIATMAVTKAIQNVFNETSIRKIIAYVHDKNAASLNLLDRVGFSREGLLREHYIINGQPANEIILGLLREDFKL